MAEETQLIHVPVQRLPPHWPSSALPQARLAIIKALVRAARERRSAPPPGTPLARLLDEIEERCGPW